MKLKIFIDGASRGNPGPGAAAAVIFDDAGSVIKEAGKFLGTCTNNFAEYSAFWLALDAAQKIGASEVSLFSDSELLVKQFNGIYKIKKPELAEFMLKIKSRASFFNRLCVAHIPREINTLADKLANKILDEHKNRILKN